jgi:hypothetical protein
VPARDGDVDWARHEGRIASFLQGAFDSLAAAPDRKPQDLDGLADFLEDHDHLRSDDFRALVRATYSPFEIEDCHALDSPRTVAGGRLWHVATGMRWGLLRLYWSVDGGWSLGSPPGGPFPPAGAQYNAPRTGAPFEEVRLCLAAALLGRAVLEDERDRMSGLSGAGRAAARRSGQKRSTAVLTGIIDSPRLRGPEARGLCRSVTGIGGGLAGRDRSATAAFPLAVLHDRFTTPDEEGLTEVAEHVGFDRYLAWRAAEIVAGRRGRNRAGHAGRDRPS